MIRIPIGNEAQHARGSTLGGSGREIRISSCSRSSRLELDGGTAKIKNLRQAERYLPDNIYKALEDFRKADWTSELLGKDVKGRYADLKEASARPPVRACWARS